MSLRNIRVGLGLRSIWRCLRRLSQVGLNQREAGAGVSRPGLKFAFQREGMSLKVLPKCQVLLRLILPQLSTLSQLCANLSSLRQKFLGTSHNPSALSNH